MKLTTRLFGNSNRLGIIAIMKPANGRGLSEQSISLASTKISLIKV